MGNPILSNYNNRLSGVRGVIQAGMGGGSYEIATWRAFNIQYQVYIEPFPAHFNHCLQVASPLTDKVTCVEAALGAVDEVKDFYICNENDSHSLANLNIARHELCQWMNMYTTIKVRTIRLETLIYELALDMNNFNLLFLDTQSTEQDVLKGGEKFLRYFDHICIEVPNSDVYEGAILKPEFDALMDGYGYSVEAEEPLNVQDIPLAYDTLYTKKELMPWWTT